MKLKQDQIELVLQQLREALDAGKYIEVEVECGTVTRDNWHTGLREAQPTDGRTITIKIDGGAKDMIGEPIWHPFAKDSA